MRIKIFALIMLLILSSMPVYAATVEMTDTKVTVNGAAATDTLLVALYSGGRFLDCKAYSGTGNYSKNYAEDMSETLPEADSVKAFLWNMNTLSPKCDSFSSAISDLPKDVQSNEYKIKLTAGTREFTATFYKNATTDALVQMMPMTLPMMDLYGNEMCYRFPNALPTDDARTQGYEVGEIMYWPPGHSFVIRYAQNGERFQMQKLGKLDSGVEFFRTCGDIDVRIELIE